MCLVHLNGRIYDPVLGRFLSADPNIDGTDDSQGYNRFSYVGNNPLNATDPSGYLSFKDIVVIVVAIVVTVVVTVATYGTGTTGCLSTFGSILSGAASGAGGAATAVVAGAAAGGFASGFTGSLLNGASIGDAFRAGAIGAATGAFTAWASMGIGGWLAEADGLGSFGEIGAAALAHGTVGGLTAEAQGGKFRHGFYASAASAGFDHSPAGKSLMRSGSGASAMARRTATAAVIGGTASVLGGGKFTNGAVTSAFQHLFNQEVSGRKEKVLALYDSADKGRAGFAGGKDMTELANKFFKDAKRVDIAGMTVEDIETMLAKENTVYDKIVFIDHGVGSLRQQIGDSWLTVNDYRALSLFLRPSGYFQLFGCDVGSDKIALQQMANIVNRGFIGFNGKPTVYPVFGWSLPPMVKVEPKEDLSQVPFQQ
jgi:hypothetical protein